MKDSINEMNKVLSEKSQGSLSLPTEMSKWQIEFKNGKKDQINFN